MYCCRDESGVFNLSYHLRGVKNDVYSPNDGKAKSCAKSCGHMP